MRSHVMKKNKIEEKRRMETRKMIRTAVPIVAALFLFLVSGCYIAYRMVSNYNYNERWKDYDECGLG